MSAPRRISRILVPVDFSEASSAALDQAAFLARTFGASVELLHVLEPAIQVMPEPLALSAGERPEPILDHGRRIAAEELDRLASRLESQGVEVRAGLETGVAWERVLHAAARADMIVMGTHGRTGLSRVLLGSVTDKVVQRSTIPVLTVRPAVREAVAAPAGAVARAGAD